MYEAKVERQDRDFTRSQDARSKYWKKVPPPARSCPIFNEVEQIVAHKSAIDPELERSPNGAWEKDSAKIFRRHIERFARYACASAELGGLGLEPDRVSLALLLNRKVVLAYIDFCSRLRVDPDEDVPLQPLLTAYDLNFVHFIRMLMHPRYGFITQRSDIFLPMIQADERPLGSCEGLDSIRARKFTFEDFDREEDATRYSKTPEEFGSLGPLVPDDLRARAEDDWLRLVIDTNARLGNMYSYMKRLVEKSRDPFEPVQEILEAERPLDHVTAMIEHAYGALPKQEAQPMLHAIAVRNLLVFLLLCVTCLRSQNIRELLYRSGDGGQIVLDRDGDTPIGLRLHIPWESFKNFSQVDFFGTPDTKRDYERYCHDWWGLAHLFDHYVENCLPLLSDRAIRKGKRVYSVLFPDSNGTAMTYDALGQIIRDFTRLNWVIDPLTGLPVEGRMAFGPHAIRDILATHIVRTATDEGRWERAANLLQTSVAMVKARYAFEKTLERAAKSDPIFDQQQAGFDRRLVLGLAR
ncbi:hypothetical protein GCM10022600_27340 [Qipengyuania pelagi]|uniref:Integrase n=1 Tax=Qipengyuania pelagi TaxID=994320 RepID=A0A844Y361_9SPHN|nr:hypothetical protein [Qipengyuania pelagi]MXO52431.1 hypothetical protein [Qipengyuania pelagi]